MIPKKRNLFNWINYFLKGFGLFLKKDYNLNKIALERSLLVNIFKKKIDEQTIVSKYPAECIIFSKNRALQLHALLLSYQENALNPVPLHILFHATSHEHRKAYDEVMKLFPFPRVCFYYQDSKETFKEKLIRIIESIESQKIFFLVDDIVFTERVDLNKFCSLNTDKFIPTLRMGLNLKSCYTLQRNQEVPIFYHGLLENSDMICWKWKQGILDWGYPLSIDGHLFSKIELLEMVKLIQFVAPNSLEANLQKFLGLFKHRYGVSYKKSVILNLPLNKVQNENNNRCGNFHENALLEKWKEGYQMDLRSLYGFMNESAHQEIDIKFMKR